MTMWQVHNVVQKLVNTMFSKCAKSLNRSIERNEWHIKFYKRSYRLSNSLIKIYFLEIDTTSKRNTHNVNSHSFGNTLFRSSNSKQQWLISTRSARYRAQLEKFLSLDAIKIQGIVVVGRFRFIVSRLFSVGGPGRRCRGRYSRKRMQIIL